MAERTAPRRFVRFGDFEADLTARRLLKGGREVPLREQLFNVLSFLLENEGEIVARGDLCRRIWPGDVVVDFENDLNTLVARLRQTLGDSADSPIYIETVPKRGYRFIAPLAGTAEHEDAGKRRTRLIVLPFLNAGGDPAQEYFSDSMTDEIITAVCRSSPEHLAVIARTTAMHYKNCGKDVACIGREVGVDYVVEGIVRRSGGHVGMNVLLVRADDQAHVFAEKYDVDMEDLFELQARISEDIVRNIPSVKGPRPKGPKGKRPSENMSAYHLYLEGRYYMNMMTPDGLARARKLLEEAVAADPQFALAHDALGEIYWWTGFYGFLPPKQACFIGMGAALRAVEIDPDLGETHAMLGQFRQKIDYSWTEVRREMKLAMELDPYSPVIRMRYAVSDLLPRGLLDEAAYQVEAGLELDPRSWQLRGWLSTFKWLARDPEAALKEARAAESIVPANYMPQFFLANAFRLGGDLDQAVTHQLLAVKFSGDAPQMLGWLGLSLGRAGRKDEARALLGRIEAAASKAYVPPTCFAWVHAGLEEYDRTMDWIERAIEDRDSFIIPIKSYPCLDPLRGDPRFQALVRMMNLEP